MIDMAKYWVEYIATMVIEADSVEDANGVFYQCFADDTRVDATIQNVEEIPQKEEWLWNAANAEKGWC